MFYLRALENDYSSTTSGIRKNYSANKYDRLFQPALIDNLFVIVKLWAVANKHAVIEEEVWSTDPTVLQALDILTAYPNEFRKYPGINYYLSYRYKDDFAAEFERFLHKLIKELLSKYLLVPTINIHLMMFVITSKE